jgi:4-oxalmesaconate hydratase
VGAVQGIDPLTGHYFDDTRRYIEGSSVVTADMRRRVYSENALGVYPRLRAHPRCC